MANVIPAGANRLPYMSDTSPVYRPFNGIALANPFTKYVTVTSTFTVMFAVFPLIGLPLSLAHRLPMKQEGCRQSF